MNVDAVSISDDGTEKGRGDSSQSKTNLDVISVSDDGSDVFDPPVRSATLERMSKARQIIRGPVKRRKKI